MASSDTPKYWKEYEAYIRNFNKKMNDSIDAMKLKDEEEYRKRPWYLKIFIIKPSEDHWNLAYYYRSREPSILGYYHWDANIRKARNSK